MLLSTCCCCRMFSHQVCSLCVRDRGRGRRRAECPPHGPPHGPPWQETFGIERELARAEAAEEERQRYAEERRRLAELEGPKPRQLSKKEQEELKAARRGQGDRTAKTGPRRRKFDPEAGKVGKFDEVE